VAVDLKGLARHTEQGLAPDCLLRRSGFRQQVKPGVRLLKKSKSELSHWESP
jgi:hypothetical protein